MSIKTRFSHHISSTRVCPNCKMRFTFNRSKYCSKRCRWRFNSHKWQHLHPNYKRNYRKKHPEYDIRYRRNHSRELSEKAMAWQRLHRNRTNEIAREGYRRNKERILARRKELRLLRQGLTTFELERTLCFTSKEDYTKDA